MRDPVIPLPSRAVDPIGRSDFRRRAAMLQAECYFTALPPFGQGEVNAFGVFSLQFSVYDRLRRLGNFLAVDEDGVIQQ